jgi:hypothetical protein
MSKTIIRKQTFELIKAVLADKPYFPDLVETLEKYVDATSNCAAMTTVGKPCAFKAINGTRYCTRHGKKFIGEESVAEAPAVVEITNVPAQTDLTKCEAVTKQGKPCSFRKTPGSSTCKRHALGEISEADAIEPRAVASEIAVSEASGSDLDLASVSEQGKQANAVSEATEATEDKVVEANTTEVEEIDSAEEITNCYSKIQEAAFEIEGLDELN